MGNIFGKSEKVYPLVFNKICLEKEECCSICLEKLDNHITLPCKHHFHEKCITEWFNNKQDCPLCRMKYRLTLTTNTYNCNAD